MAKQGDMKKYRIGSNNTFSDILLEIMCCNELLCGYKDLLIPLEFKILLGTIHIFIHIDRHKLFFLLSNLFYMHYKN